MTNMESELTAPRPKAETKLSEHECRQKRIESDLMVELVWQQKAFQGFQGELQTSQDNSSEMHHELAEERVTMDFPRKENERIKQ